MNAPTHQQPQAGAAGSEVSAEALAQWADKNGIPKAKFVEVYNAFGVVTKAKRAHQLQEAFKVQGVPALGIGVGLLVTSWQRRRHRRQELLRALRDDGRSGEKG